jgi:hypothetical protein
MSYLNYTGSSFIALCEFHALREGECPVLSTVLAKYEFAHNELYCTRDVCHKVINDHVDEAIVAPLGEYIDICSRTPMNLSNKCQTITDIQLQIIRECTPIYFIKRKKLIAYDVTIL